jgi:hypothetical protein
LIIPWRTTSVWIANSLSDVILVTSSCRQIDFSGAVWWCVKKYDIAPVSPVLGTDVGAEDSILLLSSLMFRSRIDTECLQGLLTLGAGIPDSSTDAIEWQYFPLT